MGFFSMVTPRMDAVEEITVTGAVPGSGGGAGSVQVAMTTRSGTNQFDGSAYEYYRSATRNNGLGYPLVLPGETHPVLLAQRSRLGPPAFACE